MPLPIAFLKTDHNRILNQKNQMVFLRGVGLGGWMNMENFITGFPANEVAFRTVVSRVFGGEKLARDGK